MLSDNDIKLINDAIAYTVSCILDENDPESISACNNYKNLAVRLIKHDHNISAGEIKNICMALELFINDPNNKAIFIHMELLNRMRAMTSYN